MSWTYRIMSRVDSAGETVYGIHEVASDYWDAVDQQVLSWTSEPVRMSADSIEELGWQLREMLAALDKPVIDMDKLTEERRS